MFSNILEYLKDIWFFWRARRDITCIFNTFGIDVSDTEAWKALHGMYNHAISLTADEDAFEAAYASQGKKHDRAWMYLQFIVAKGDLSFNQLLETLNSFRTFGRMVDVFGMEKVGVMLTILPDLWWSNDDKSDTGSAGSVC